MIMPIKNMIKNNSQLYIKLFISGFLLIIIIMVLSVSIAFWLLDSWENTSNFADSFGLANTLFSGLAFSGVLVTLFMQREELELQRKELQETRKEVQGQREAQEAASKALNEQVESMWTSARLNLLSTLHQHYSEIRNDAQQRISKNTDITHAITEWQDAKRSLRDIDNEIIEMHKKWFDTPSG